MTTRINRVIGLCAISLLSMAPGFEAQAEQPKEEEQVLRTLLTHFGKQGKDAFFYSKTGRILVDPIQIAAPADHGKAFAKDGKCKPSKKLMLAMSESKNEVLNWTTFPSSDSWELMGPEEARKRNFMELPRDSRGEVAKTIVSLMRPVLTADGKQAFVAFDFIWSIHGAHAWYVLSRDKGSWRVSCFEMVHFV